MGKQKLLDENTKVTLILFYTIISSTTKLILQ